MRRRIPLDLIAAYGGVKEIVRALHTADPTEANMRNRRAWVDLDEEFAAKRKELACMAGEQAETEAQASRRNTALRAAPFDVRQSLAVARLRNERQKAAANGGLEEWTLDRRRDLALHQSVLEGGEPAMFSMESHE
ncbi:MAG: DUF6538 domain-containing protein, partial [Novosphingobium sp.]